MSGEAVRKILVKFNEADSDNTTKGNLVKRGIGISRESEGVYVRTEDGTFLFLPSLANLADDGASRIGIDSQWHTGTVKQVLDAHAQNWSTLGSLAVKSDITDVDVRADAAIAWSKISKVGASALDLNATPLVDGKIPAQYLPSVATSEVHTVASQAEMLALSAESGDYAIRSDLGKKFMLVGSPSVLADWVPVGDGGVLSVDGRVGVVTLTDLYKPIGWFPSWTEITGKPTTFAPSAHNHAWSEITSGKPTTLAGYGITDAQPLDADLTALAGLSATGVVKRTGANAFSAGALVAGDIPNLDWGKITTGKPTTLSGYGITDAASSGHTHTTFGALTLSGALGGTTGTFSGAVSAASLSEGGVQLATKYALAGHTHTAFGALTLSGSIWFDADNAYNIGDSNARVGGIYALIGSFDAISARDVQVSNTLTAASVVSNGLLPYSAGTGAIGRSDQRYGTGYFTALDATSILISGVNINSTFATASHTHAWSAITSKPTTLSGYGITDAATSGHTHTTFGALTLTGNLTIGPGQIVADNMIVRKYTGNAEYQAIYPGGLTPSDTNIAYAHKRDGTVTALNSLGTVKFQIAGLDTFTSTSTVNTSVLSLVVPNATADAHAVNRVTADGRYRQRGKFDYVYNTTYEGDSARYHKIATIATDTTYATHEIALAKSFYGLQHFADVTVSIGVHRPDTVPSIDATYSGRLKNVSLFTRIVGTNVEIWCQLVSGSGSGMANGFALSASSNYSTALTIHAGGSLSVNPGDLVAIAQVDATAKAHASTHSAGGSDPITSLGGVTFTANIITPNATADTHALNRITADGRFSPIGHTHTAFSTLTLDVLRFNANPLYSIINADNSGGNLGFFGKSAQLQGAGDPMVNQTVGTITTTIPDWSPSYSQANARNITRSLGDKIAKIESALRAYGLLV